MNRRVTIREIAEVLGVHLTTAARALKNDPRISEATRKQVNEEARKRKYVPDPMLSAIAEYRKRIRPAGFQGTMAWVTNFPTRDGWRNGATEAFHDGALERCSEIGYHLETFWLKENGMTFRRASTVLAARGIRGLILCPHSANRGHVRLLWDKFALVTIGYSIIRPKLHMVTTAHFEAVVICVRRLRAMGFRRIGMALGGAFDERTAHMWTAAFRSEIPIVPASVEIPIFSPKDFRLETFHAWFERYRPEAIVTANGEVIDWLRKLGYSVPGDVSVALINIHLGRKDLTGTVERSDLVGRFAVDHVVGMLQRGEYGLPSVATRLLVDPEWVDGATIEPKHLSKSDAQKVRPAFGRARTRED